MDSRGSVNLKSTRSAEKPSAVQALVDPFSAPVYLQEFGVKAVVDGAV
jgi:hypothetical protein